MQYLAVAMIYCSVTAAPLHFRRLCIASTLFTLSYRVIPGELNLELLIMHFLFFFPVVIIYEKSEAAERDCFIFVPHFTIMHTTENRGPGKILLLEELVRERVWSRSQ